MCGRIIRIAEKQALAESVHARVTGDPLAYAPACNIGPTTSQPVLRQTRDWLDREIVPMRWGMVGFGSVTINPKISTFNAALKN
jgi:putative SOS response-associated peptidase YedK